MIRLFKVFIPTSVVGLVVSEALLVLACYCAAFYLTGGVSLDLYLLYDYGNAALGVVLASILLGIYFQDLYSEFRVWSRIYLVQQYCLVFGFAFLAQAFLGYLNRDLILPRWHMIVGSGLGLLILPLWRMAYSGMVFSMMNPQRVLFLGDSPLARATAAHLREHPEFALVPAGYLAPERDPEAEALLGVWTGAPGEVLAVWTRIKPQRLIVGMAERRGRLPVFDLVELRRRGAFIEEVGRLYETIRGRVPLSALRPSDLIFSPHIGPKPAALAFQRVYSVAGAVLALALTAPLLAVVALLVRLTSPGPALYAQKRVGLGGKVFKVLKFRSMYVDAEARTGAVWATRDDPRITPLGRWLRKLRIDEFPQFINVLKGEMAIAGPRPERPEFVRALAEQIPFYNLRHSVLPGITGWAQINHKYGDTFEDTVTKLEYDLYYLKNLSPSLDLYILFHTLKVMLLGRGSQ
jgi:exopolysaccharide biosynthesis polyprenyl glycosylphosphotransferase